MMSVVPGVACLAASAVAGVVLRWMAARRARAIEAAGGEHRVHELRVALFRATRVAAVCGSVAAGGYLGAVLGQLSDPVAVLSALAVIVAGVAGPVAAARRPIASALARARGVPRARMTPRGLGMAALLFLIRGWPARGFRHWRPGPGCGCGAACATARGRRTRARARWAGCRASATWSSATT